MAGTGVGVMKKVWVLGAGKFGRLAAKRLINKFSITLVEADQAVLNDIKIPGIDKVCADGVEFLSNCLTKSSDVAWIVPCLPVHMAWEWCRNRLGKERLNSMTLPGEIDLLLPNPMRGSSTHIYVSHADFICPDNCNEPDAFCTHTKQPRQQDMHALLASLCFKDYTPLVLKSRQLTPGVGGASPEDLFQLLDKIETTGGHLLVCTACRCHAVVTGAVMVTKQILVRRGDDAL